MMRLFMIIAAIGFLPSVANAQQPAAPTTADPVDGVVYKKNTEYDFEDDNIEGSFVRPEGEYLDARRRARYSSLIRVRKDFIPEMLKSAEDI
ncbi:MAG: hypothetical protein VX589_17245 [Myxococcota bacterium]|nr:hypothetical protein [Myxococcota bacterium]